MIAIRQFLHNRSGATAAEFALILPIALLFLLGLIDVGRYTWAFSQAEKATQTGARWASVTTLIPGGEDPTDPNIFFNYDYAINKGVTQGTTVPRSMFDNIRCTADANANPTCVCETESGGTCDFTHTGNKPAFVALANRMREIYPGIGPQNIAIDYEWSGLGYAGDPNGADIQPLISVSVVNKRFPLWFMLGTTVPFPASRYTITAEDTRGDFSY